MKKTFLAVLFFTGLSVQAQNLDSLFNEYVKIKTGAEINVKQKSVTAVQGERIKCAFGIVNSVRVNYNLLTPDQQKLYLRLSTRPTSDTSFVTPNGYFRIHYFKSGTNAPGYDLNELAKAVDSSYNYEVNILGYPPPPKDFGTSAEKDNPDDLYDIYLQNLTSDTYGYTQAEDDLGNSKYTSYMVIDNDFSNYNTKGIDGARVTVAHEMHHGIQMGNYVFRSEDAFYHEITSTSMEEFVYDSINDYYYDLPTFMWNPQRAFASNSGYDLAIWNLFMSSEFGVNIIKRTWELMPQERALNAIADAISERDSSFKKEFAKFGLWLWFTGPRAIPGKYFKEAANYPLVHPFMTLGFSKPETIVSANSEPVSTNILVFTNNTGSKIDTLVSIISNTDITNGIDNLSYTTSFKYHLANQSAQGYRNIIGDFYSDVESSADFLFAETNVFNNFPVEGGRITSAEIGYPYPQPFRTALDNFIYFPVTVNQSGNVELYIYSVDMNLVYSGEVKVLALNNAVVQWNCKDKWGKKLGSGIYFYVIKSGDTIKKGKFAVLND